MNDILSPRNLRRLAAIILSLGALTLGATNATWAAPGGESVGQTVPTRTPAGGPNPTSTATRTPTPRRRNPTATPVTPSTTATATATATSTGNGNGNGNGNGQNLLSCLLQAPDGVNTIECRLGPVTLIIPRAAFPAGAAVSIQLIDPAVRGPNAGERFFGPQAELTLLDANGNLIASPTFSQPITLCYTYDPTDLATVGNSGAFSIELLNTATNQWQRLTTTPDTANSRVCTQLSHFSSYVLGGRLATPSSLPNTGTAAQPLVGAWLWVLLAVALGAGASIKARMIQRTVVPAPVLAKETEASETSIKE